MNLKDAKLLVEHKITILEKILKPEIDFLLEGGDQITQEKIDFIIKAKKTSEKKRTSSFKYNLLIAYLILKRKYPLAFIILEIRRLKSKSINYPERKPEKVDLFAPDHDFIEYYIDWDWRKIIHDEYFQKYIQYLETKGVYDDHPSYISLKKVLEGKEGQDIYTWDMYSRYRIILFQLFERDKLEEAEDVIHHMKVIISEGKIPAGIYGSPSYKSKLKEFNYMECFCRGRLEKDETVRKMYGWLTVYLFLEYAISTLKDRNACWGINQLLEILWVLRLLEEDEYEFLRYFKRYVRASSFSLYDVLQEMNIPDIQYEDLNIPDDIEINY